jgi:hypothetical protein
MTPDARLCSDKGMKIALDIEEEDIERIVRSLDNQHAYTRSRSLEESGYKRLADLFRGFLKRGPGQAASPSEDQPVRHQRGR